ncbi:MAG: DUF2975 domain-containing protein [Winogradskyella sp.]|uniref:DUF2975 domain-containing protein n=1 Tax=Winogradskyella sp. TaxID=1883156 RepID=UPI0025E8D5F0|nr:DUF2975 domain-containing protein [Winogradskyella sp.]NRB84338.1 DUF2975 domain-containing protein [Winogradskyella sp.]
MTKNTLLNIAILFSRLLKGLFILGLLVLSGLFIYVQVNSKDYENREVKLSESKSIFGFYLSGSSTNHSIDEIAAPYTLGKLKTVSLYLNYFKGIIVLVLVYMATNAFEKIMLSVKSLKTFNSSNSRLFRKIGIYIIIVILLTSYSVLRFEDGIQTKMVIDFVPLTYALLAFILAQIFKEGSILKQENELTI